jgi:hypothetical protein
MGLSALALLSIGSIQAIDLIEEFDGAEIDPAVWEVDRNKLGSLTGGHLEIEDDGGDWARYAIKSEQRFFVPPAGQTSVFEWELAPGSITTDAGQSIRIQIGIVSSNEPNPNPEHWPNTTGGIWIDIDNIQSFDTANVSGNIHYADDTKAAESNGNILNGISLPWNWETENKILRLELTNDDFKWFDGATLLGESTLADSGIDNEFGNGFRVIAIGMNFASGRGTTAFERIAVTNGQGPSELLQSFASSLPTAFAGQKYDLTWTMDPNASATIDQGIGNVDALTTDGMGSTELIAPDITEPSSTVYTITVSKAGEPDETRQVTVNVVPASELCLDNFSDDFSSGFIDELNWSKRGNDTSTVSDDTVTWDNTNIGNWAHGEIGTNKVFPIPPAGSPTTITWNLGKATETMADGDEPIRALRPVMGVVSAFANNSWTLQHWQNIEGGLWLDINVMSSADTTSVGGGIHYADDTKVVNTNAAVASNVTVPGWNWQTEDQEFSLVMTDTSYTWFAGDTELGGGLYADAGIDTEAGGEFSKGFRVMFAAVNYNGGRGTISLNSIDVQNGSVAGPAGPPVITNVIDNNDGTMTLSWNSIGDAEYAIHTSATLNNDWVESIDGIMGTGASTSFSVNTSGDKLFYRVVRIP